MPKPKNTVSPSKRPSSGQTNVHPAVRSYCGRVVIVGDVRTGAFPLAVHCDDTRSYAVRCRFLAPPLRRRRMHDARMRASCMRASCMHVCPNTRRRTRMHVRAPPRLTQVEFASAGAFLTPITNSTFRKLLMNEQVCARFEWPNAHSCIYVYGGISMVERREYCVVCVCDCVAARAHTHVCCLETRVAVLVLAPLVIVRILHGIVHESV